MNTTGAYLLKTRNNLKNNDIKCKINDELKRTNKNIYINKGQQI